MRWNYNFVDDVFVEYFKKIVIEEFEIIIRFLLRFVDKDEDLKTN